MKLSITLISIVGSLLCISPIFGEDNIQCKSNQECIKLRDCPYTKNLLTRVLSSSDRQEKNNMISEMRKLVCKPSDRSVCCDIEESEAEAEAEGNHEDSEAEAEGNYEADPEAEGDHEDSEPEAEGDHEDSEAEVEGNYEESNPEAEGDHEESEAEAEGSSHDDQNEITDNLGNFTFHYLLRSFK